MDPGNAVEVSGLEASRRLVTPMYGVYAIYRRFGWRRGYLGGALLLLLGSGMRLLLILRRR
jgi:hypothetical protein